MDYLIDLKKDGSEFSVLANTHSGEKLVGLPNTNLSNELRTQLEKVYTYLFGEDLPLGGEEGISFLIKYREDRAFDKLYYPCIVRGSEDNQSAPDSTKLYIRWGLKFFPLEVKEEKKGKQFVQSFIAPTGEELDTAIVGYGFNGDKYLDPALSITFFDDEEDMYIMHFPIKVIVEDTETKPDYVASLNTALKRGYANFLAMISQATEFQAFAKTINPAELEKNLVYMVNGYVVSQARNGKDIIKLTLATPHEEQGEIYDEVWTPFELMNFIKTRPQISDDSPWLLVLTGSTVEVSKSNGREYTKPLVALVPDTGVLVPGSHVSEAEAKELYAQTVEEYISKFRYAPTFSDRDLDVDIKYTVVGYTKRSSENNTFYKLDIVDPRDDNKINIWCPNRLVPTLTRMFPELEGSSYKGNSYIPVDSPCFFRVVSKSTRGDKVYAHSVLDFDTKIPGGMDLSFIS